MNFLSWAPTMIGQLHVFKLHRNEPWKDYENCTSISEEVKKAVLKENWYKIIECLRFKFFNCFMIHRQIPFCLMLIHAEWLSFIPQNGPLWMSHGSRCWTQLIGSNGNSFWPAWVRTQTRTNILRAYELGNWESIDPGCQWLNGRCRKELCRRGQRWGREAVEQLSRPAEQTWAFSCTKRGEVCPITFRILRTWAKLGTDFFDLPFWIHFHYVL